MAAGKLKIVVLGSFNAGKSTFIQAIDSHARHIEAPAEEGSTTVAMDFGRSHMQNLDIFLFGTPGQERFEFVREIIMRGMDAAIIMVDTTAAIDDFTMSLYNGLSSSGVPFAVMLNKCDLSGESAASVGHCFCGALTFRISSNDGESARNALEMFVGSVMKDL